MSAGETTRQILLTFSVSDAAKGDDDETLGDAMFERIHEAMGLLDPSEDDWLFSIDTWDTVRPKPAPSPVPPMYRWKVMVWYKTTTVSEPVSWYVSCDDEPTARAIALHNMAVVGRELQIERVESYPLARTNRIESHPDER